MSFSFLLSLLVVLQYANGMGTGADAGTTSSTRSSENKNKIRIEIDPTCKIDCDTLKHEVFSNYSCLHITKTYSKSLSFKKACIIYANISQDSSEKDCYAKLENHPCVMQVHYEPVFYVDQVVDYTSDLCITQDLGAADPCLKIYDTAYSNFDGTQCASDYLDHFAAPLYHLNYWYPNTPNDPYSYIYLDTSTIPHISDIDVWILDSGIDRTHIEFEGIEIVKVDYASTDPETFSSHGTAVASQAIGKYIGIARGFKVFDCAACQSGTSCSFEDIENCYLEIIEYYTANPTKRCVINMSFSGIFSTVYTDNLDDIVALRGILVASAGNGGSNIDLFLRYPASHASVIAIGGYNSDKNIYSGAGSSNYGAETVRYYAAAQENLVAFRSASTPNNNKDYYTFFSGTSFSSPIVAGEVANLLARDYSLTLEEIREELDSRVVGNVGNCPVSSCPMIQGYCNVNGATRSRNPTTVTSTPTLRPTPGPLFESCTIIKCKTVNTPITDFGTFRSTIEISSEDIPYQVHKLKSMKVRAAGTHTYQGDLSMSLSSPEGTGIILVSGVGGFNHDFDITFSSDALSFPPNLNVGGLEYLPKQSFSTFAGINAIGSWNFSLQDVFGGDNGVWDYWCILELCYSYNNDTLSPTNEPTMVPSSNPVQTATTTTQNPITNGTFDCTFGLFLEDSLPYDLSWQRMTLADWNSYREDLISFYDSNNGIPVIQSYARTYCCMKTSDDHFVYGVGLGNIGLNCGGSVRYIEGDVYHFSGSLGNVFGGDYLSIAPITAFISSSECGSNGHTELFVNCDINNTIPEPTPRPTYFPTKQPTKSPTDSSTSQTCITDSICQNVELLIPDAGMVQSTISVHDEISNIFSDLIPVFKHMKVRVKGSHPYSQVFTISLTSPDGTTALIVSNRPNFAQSSFDLLFSDTGVSLWPISNNETEVAPQTLFSEAFSDQNPIGEWTMSLADSDSIPDFGYWNKWCIVELCWEYKNESFPGLESTTREPIICCKGRVSQLNDFCKSKSKNKCASNKFCKWRRNKPDC